MVPVPGMAWVWRIRGSGGIRSELAVDVRRGVLPTGGEQCVRWAESQNRKETHGVVGFQGKPKNTKRIADENGADYVLNKHGEVIMNDDNDANRRTVEQCYRTRKTMVNPIVDWTDDDVWNFLNGNGIEHCSLYDEGFKRLGCIGCPLSGSKNMLRDFERWPKYKQMYINAFQKMIDNHPGQIKILDPNADTKFKLYDDLPDNTFWGGVQSRAYFTSSAEAFRWYVFGWPEK